jgi:hypothetical protein
MDNLNCNSFFEIVDSVDSDMSDIEEAVMFREAKPMPLAQLSPEELEGVPIYSVHPCRAKEKSKFLPAISATYPERVAPSNNLGRIYSRWIDGSASFSTAQRVFDYEYSGFDSSNILLTAAHCVYERDDDGGRGKPFQIYFYSGYDDGKYIQRHRIEACRIPPEWRESGKAEAHGRDYAFCRIRSFSYDCSDINVLPADMTIFPVTAYGYPNNFGFGRVPMKVKGQVALDVPGVVGMVQMFGNSFGPGCSGGGWYTEDIPGRLIGINSWSFPGSDGLFSSRFDSRFIREFRNTWESWREISGPPLPEFPPADPFRPKTINDPG